MIIYMCIVYTYLYIIHKYVHSAYKYRYTHVDSLGAFGPRPGAPWSLRHCVVVTVSLLGCLRLKCGKVVGIF